MDAAEVMLVVNDHDVTKHDDNDARGVTESGSTGDEPRFYSLDTWTQSRRAAENPFSTDLCASAPLRRVVLRAF
jgi:hypothetical protein